MTTQPASPWDVANNPPEQMQNYYGEASINAWWCMLVPGQGKQPYDERTLQPNGEPPRKYTAIDVMVNPLTECNLKFDLKRTMLAEFGEWKDVTWPSLKALGVMNAQEIAGKFVAAELIPTGRKYTNGNGEEKEATAIKFVAIYPTRDACLAAWEGRNGSNGHHQSQSAPWEAAPAAAAPANSSDKDRQTALTFATVYVRNAVRAAGGDLDKTRAALAPQLAQQSLIAKFFTVDSPEITDLIVVEMSK